MLIFLMYVNDILLIENNSKLINDFVVHLDQKISFKDLGFGGFFLGI